MKMKESQAPARTCFLSCLRGIAIQASALLLAMVILPMQASAENYQTEDLTVSIDTVGRVDHLSMRTTPATPILFYDNSPTGGFYIRENTLPSGSQIPAGCTNILEESTLDDGSIVNPPGVPDKWTLFRNGTVSDTPIENAVVPGTSNYAAQIKVGETREDPYGHYGGIYQVLGPDKLGTPNPAEHELYYLTFEVKTKSGWRAKGRLDGHTQADDDLYGFHRISAYIEWSEGGFSGDPGRYPATPLGNQFYAYGTSQEVEVDGSHLTRFCGRTYRAKDMNYARIVLLAEGFMPLERLIPEEKNEVYFDNVYFFKAPPIIQVAGTDLFESEPLDPAPLYEFGNPTNLLNLEMYVQGTVVNDDYIRIAGTLTNTLNDEPRAIDLGFAFPIKDNSSSQSLEWHYDVGNRILLSEAEDLDRAQPFTFTGPIDIRPVTTSTRDFPTSGFEHNHNQQISVYPISSLGIETGGTQYGLAFGDDLADTPPDDPFAPSISHFGYRIVHPTADPGVTDDGYYYVEINIGLLPGSSPRNYTDFSFIIFRSDNPEFAEASSFREGLQKYQRDIFPTNFQRPILTDELDWLFGGGKFTPRRNEQMIPYWDTNGFTVNPNDFGFRYTQGLGNFDLLLSYCEDYNVGYLLYDLPWAGAFEPSTDDDKHTYTKLHDARDEYHPPGIYYDIYTEKILKVLSIPPNDQEIFASGPYRFPVILADSPVVADPSVGGALVDEELEAYNTLYDDNARKGECFSGMMFDVTFNYAGNSNHLDLTDSRMENFVKEGGRLTYSFNHFIPAIPQLCTNTWFFPHVKSKLESIDSSHLFGDNDSESSENQEKEIIGVNATEFDFGGSKYGIINADVIGFESSADKDSNNSSHSFNFRRSVARDKSVARKFNLLVCTENVGEMLDPEGRGPAGKFWGSRVDLARQIFDEVSWIALAWGFHPSVDALFPSEFLHGDEASDQFVDTYIRYRFALNDGGPAFGYTEIFRQLHLAGWQPATNVVNTADSTTAPGDPTKLYIERFGPYEGIANTKPVYVTMLNNEDFKVTCTDVVDFDSTFGVSISELETDLEVERSNICEGKYGNPDEYDSKDLGLFIAASDAEDKNFYLVFSDLEELMLDEGNLHGLQMIQAIEDDPEEPITAVNYPTTIADGFSAYGANYSIIRYNHGTQLRLGGRRFLMNPQEPGIIEDKALMVFKIWTTRGADNGGQGGGGGRSEADDPYYQRVGNWSTVTDETARHGSVDVISSEEMGAYALFSIDIAGNAVYDVQIAYPDMAEGTTGAKYEVYLREESYDAETGETTGSTISGPLLTTIVDQSRGHTETMDEDRFASIGEIVASRGSNVDRLSVVVKVSSAGAEYLEGRATLLLADAVRIENLDR